MVEYFERDVPLHAQALKPPCPPSAANCHAGPASPEIDLKPSKARPLPSMQRHPGVLRLRMRSGEVDIPPALYPGATIPFELVLELAQPRRAGSLKLNLIGTLKTPYTTRVVVDIVTDLPSGPGSWIRGEGNGDDRCAPTACDAGWDDDYIPAGQWRQSVCVQLPRQSVLPPSVRVMWEMRYRFRLVLCPAGQPRSPTSGDLSGCLVAEQPVEILPATMPEPAPLLFPTSFWIARPRSLATERWSAHISLPTSTFGPTSVIPVSIALAGPPYIGGHHVAVTLSLVREEMVTTRIGPGSSSQRDWSTVALIRRLVRAGDGREACFLIPLDLRDSRGLTPSSSIEVGPADKLDDDDECLWMSASSNAALKVKCEYKLHLNLEFGTGSKNILVPVVIGSVGEPRDAVRQYEWSELYVPPTGSAAAAEHAPSGCGEGSLHLVGNAQRDEPTPVLIWGTEEGSEDGWLVPPPSYREALNVVPYVYDPTV